MTNDLANLDVFYGDLTVNRAYLYARLPRPADDVGLSLVGTVRGPRCLYAETLPLTLPLTDLGAGPTLLARALVPDPCFWSPDLPAIYDVTVNLLRGAEIVATERREIGLRSLGVRGRNLFLEGKRWVLRGVHDRSATATLPRAWHEVSAVYVTKTATHDNLAEGSQFGAMSMVDFDGELAVDDQLRSLARQPGVAIAIIRGNPPVDFKRADAAPNLLLAQPIGRHDLLVRKPWAHLMLAETVEPMLLRQVAALGEIPILVSRPLAAPLPIDQARAACDTLQRDLAPLGQFAGYIV